MLLYFNNILTDSFSMEYGAMILLTIDSLFKFYLQYCFTIFFSS